MSFHKRYFAYIVHRSNPPELVRLDIMGVSNEKDTVDMLLKCYNGVDGRFLMIVLLVMLP